MSGLWKIATRWFNGTSQCKVCKEAAPNKCSICDATLCDRCNESHKKYEHPFFECGTCKEPARWSSTYCPTCKTEFCKVCGDKHKIEDKSREHRVLKKEHIVVEESSSILDTLLNPIAPLIGKKCVFCSKRLGTNNVCSMCDQPICADCISAHEAFEHGSEEDVTDATFKCGECLNAAKNVSAFCTTCKIELCKICELEHLHAETTKQHRLLVDHKNTSTLDGKSPTGNRLKNPRVPGKPWVYKEIKADSLTVKWDRPNEMIEADRFQLGYTEVHDTIIWEIWPKLLTTNEVILDGLKSNTKYRFRVRVVHQGIEWPYSERSDVITTKQSLAATIVQNGKLKVKSEGPPKVYLLPTEELLLERDQEAKIKKYEFGEKDHLKLVEHEKTIMLVGESGTGKTTLVEGIINYVTGVSFDDPYRFSMVQLEDSEKAKLAIQTKSQTEWISCYTLHRKDGGRLDYTLTIIDTPGFGDTGGTDFDRKTKDQIRTLFTQKCDKGVLFLDAICFLSKAPDARSNLPQKYIFELILSIFGKDVKDNICSLITFCDGKTPPVIQRLDESGLNFKHHFRFNNSALFSSNVQKNEQFTKMYWDMGFQSFQTFFLSLEEMKQTGLEQTKHVLNERLTLENTLDAMHDRINDGISIVSELDGVVQNIEKHQSEIEQNENFCLYVLKVEKRRKQCESGTRALECTECNETCHETCKYSKKKDKTKCVVMNENACCMKCLKNCSAEKHTYTDSILYRVREREQMLCSEMRLKYRKAVKNKILFEQIQQEEIAKLEKHKDEVYKQMQKVEKCQKKLNEIALRPNISSLEEYIDLLIAQEENTPSVDHLGRMKVLQMYKRKANPEKLNEDFKKKTEKYEPRSNTEV